MDTSNQFNELRKRAQDLLKSEKKEFPDIQADDINKLIHELQTRQVELELQNEDLRRAQHELEESRINYMELYEFAPVGYFSIDRNGLILESNLAGTELLGIERRWLAGKNFSRFISPDFRELYNSHKEHVLAETGTSHTCELNLVKKDGSLFFAVLRSITMLDPEGNFTRIQIAVTDISKRKQAEELTQKALAEKEILLRELHHRVKNNLQVLISLIDMQADDAKDPGIFRALSALKGRARTMALVHDRLHQSGDLGQIDCRMYMEDLVINQFSALGSRHIMLHTDFADIKISIDIAIPCGLIINELITNALKYAFPPEHEKSDCEIRVGFNLPDKEYILTVSDNGQGIPLGTEWNKGESLGFELVNMLATHQLEGSIKTDMQNGVSFTIRFPKGR